MNLARYIFCLLKVILHTMRSSFVQMHTSHLQKGPCKVIDKRLKRNKQSFATLTDFQTGNNQSLNQHIGEVILIPNQPLSSGGPNHQQRPLNCKYHHEQIQTQIPKNTTGDGGSTALCTFHCLYCSNWFTLLKQKYVCYIYCEGRLEHYWNGLMSF